MLTIKKLTETFCESEPDLCSRMNNLSGWKRNLKKFKLDQEWNPDLCDGWMLRSVRRKGEGSIPSQAWVFLGSFFNFLHSSFHYEDHVHFHIFKIRFTSFSSETFWAGLQTSFSFIFAGWKKSYRHSFSSLGHQWWKLWCGCDSLWWKW